MGGRKEDLNDGSADNNQSESSSGPDDEMIPKIFSKKRINSHVTSRIGNMFSQKIEIPSGLTQQICYSRS